MVTGLRHDDIPALNVLAPRRELSPQEWVVLLEKRYGLLMRVIDQMKLLKLSQVYCLKGEFSRLQELGRVDNITAPEGLSLDTTGIFALQPLESIQFKPNSGFRPGPNGGVARPDGTKRLWGLTQKGQWVVVTVQFTGHAGYKQRGEELAESITIEIVQLDQMLEITQKPAEDVWSELGGVIKRFAVERQQQIKFALKLASIVAVEEAVYGHVSSTP